jgi:hypothetical protein
MKKYLLIALSLFIYTCDDDPATPTDCAGVANGLATTDNCGVCDDDDTNNDTTCTQDCAGVWDGSAVVDACGVCDGDDSTCADCAGVPNGSSTTDNCGVCDDDSTNDDTTCTQDCLGVWGGSAVADCLGECNGSAVVDCDGQCNGTATEDCAGVCNGPATEDNCGTCDADSSNDCVADCAGTPGGSAVEDACGVCDGDGSSCADCAGVPNGDAVEDACGVCEGDGSSCADCLGVPNGDAVVDCAGVCNGDGVDADGDGNCDAQDCEALPAQNVLFMNAAGDVYYNFTEPCGGFQFVVEGATATAGAGGAAGDAAFSVSAGGSTVLGFSFTGATIPAGSGILTSLTLNGTPTGLSGITLSTASAANMHDVDATDLCE